MLSRDEQAEATDLTSLLFTLHVTPILDAEGSCTHLIGVVHDITERKQTEDALLRTRDLLLQTSHTARVGG